jgi:translation initiation factor 1
VRGKTKRVDITGPASPLTSNPFSQLGATPPERLRESPEPAQPPQEPRARKPQAAFRVERTRKGSYPIIVERRAAGKSVTIVRNLSGDTEALLALLKKHCAAGGKAFADSIEIQGDHRAKVETFLREKGL